MKLVSVVLGALILAGFGGALHPAGDALAVFRVPFLLLFALAVIWSMWPRKLRWPLAGLAMLGLLPHVWWPTTMGEGLTLYQQNLLWNRTEYDAWLAAVRAARPDFLTLQEVSEKNLALLDALRPLYPYQHHCPFGPELGEAVLSRHPLIEGSTRCSGRDGFAAAQVDLGGAPIWLVSLHLTWPWPYDQAQQVASLLPELRALEGPVILGGDFNSVAWSHTLARVAEATRTKRVGRYVKTFSLPGIGLPIEIDHVLAPQGKGQRLRPLPKLGSDHHGLWAVIKRP
ncbi:endonuclease/exonuclease/phosphatase family protein [Primorskyibacter sp. 2E233]|uniref:endonuclease/exonuclease/phosphatase family protein n=1 Tax=Primorskyibacter sp. 2E233 TaxID=3413431 RepID=UPI003BF40BB4